MPPSASSNSPTLSRTASVKAPRACPNSSDSSSAAGMAAQLTATKRRSARGEASWMARATSSLPVPLSPWMSTVLRCPATRVMVARSSAIGRDSPTSRAATVAP